MNPADPLDAVPQALRDAVLDPDRRDQTVIVDGADVRVRFDPEPGVDQRVHVAEGGRELTVTRFEGAAERPASYPADLPYLPGQRGSVSTPGGPAAVRSVTWWSLADLQGALAQVRAQSAAAGWIEYETPGADILPGLRMIEFHHPDGRERLVQTVAGGETAMMAVYDEPAA
jgi:hypothetical protein